MAKGKIKNSISPKNVVSSPLVPDKSYTSKNVIFDFSSKTAFCSVSYGGFNNYLKNPNDYVEQFRALMRNVGILSDYTLSALINGGSHRHCHKIEGDKEKLARSIIRKLFSDDRAYDQEIDAEELFQLGCQDGVRVIGIIKGNIFRVYFIDYFHDLYPDDRYNIRNVRNYKFCPICGTLYSENTNSATS
jgi:hypothetical protein